MKALSLIFYVFVMATNASAQRDYLDDFIDDFDSYARDKKEKKSMRARYNPSVEYYDADELDLNVKKITKPNSELRDDRDVVFSAGFILQDIKGDAGRSWDAKGATLMLGKEFVFSNSVDVVLKGRINYSQSKDFVEIVPGTTDYNTEWIDGGPELELGYRIAGAQTIVRPFLSLVLGYGKLLSEYSKIEFIDQVTTKKTTATITAGYFNLAVGGGLALILDQRFVPHVRYVYSKQFFDEDFEDKEGVVISNPLIDGDLESSSVELGIGYRF